MNYSKQFLMSAAKVSSRTLVYLFTLYMFSVYMVAFLMPSDVLDYLPMLRELVDVLAVYIPSIERIGLTSHVPQIAQLVLVYELFWMPVLGYIGIRSVSIERNVLKAKSYPVRFYFLTPLVIVFVFWGIFFFFPGNPGGEAWSSKIEGSILTSRFGLASWTGLLFGGGGAAMFFLTYLYIRTFPRVLSRA